MYATLADTFEDRSFKKKKHKSILHWPYIFKVAIKSCKHILRHKYSKGDSTPLDVEIDKRKTVWKLYEVLFQIATKTGLPVKVYKSSSEWKLIHEKPILILFLKILF